MNSGSGIARSDLGIGDSHIGTLRTAKETPKTDTSIRKSEKQFVRTGSGAFNSETGIGNSLKGVSKSWKRFGEGKTAHGKFNKQFWSKDKSWSG